MLLLRLVDLVLWFGCLLCLRHAVYLCLGVWCECCLLCWQVWAVAGCEWWVVVDDIVLFISIWLLLIVLGLFNSVDLIS